jgi:hypothetical protein
MQPPRLKVDGSKYTCVKVEENFISAKTSTKNLEQKDKLSCFIKGLYDGFINNGFIRLQK